MFGLEFQRIRSIVAGLNAATSWQKHVAEQGCLVHENWEAKQGTAVPEKKGPEAKYRTQGHASITHSEMCSTNPQSARKPIKLAMKLNHHGTDGAPCHTS